MENWEQRNLEVYKGYGRSLTLFRDSYNKYRVLCVITDTIKNILEIPEKTYVTEKEAWEEGDRLTKEVIDSYEEAKNYYKTSLERLLASEEQTKNVNLEDWFYPEDEPASICLRYSWDDEIHIVHLSREYIQSATRITAHDKNKIVKKLFEEIKEAVTTHR